jgi:hypothetical protein
LRMLLRCTATDCNWCQLRRVADDVATASIVCKR